MGIMRFVLRMFVEQPWVAIAVGVVILGLAVGAGVKLYHTPEHRESRRYFWWSLCIGEVVVGLVLVMLGVLLLAFYHFLMREAIHA